MGSKRKMSGGLAFEDVGSDEYRSDFVFFLFFFSFLTADLVIMWLSMSGKL